MRHLLALSMGLALLAPSSDALAFAGDGPAELAALAAPMSLEQPAIAQPTLVATSPSEQPTSLSSGVVLWLRAGDPPNWQVLAVLVWLALTAALKASSRLRANEPLELAANILVRVPLVGQVAKLWATPGGAAPPPVPPAAAALALLLLPSRALAAGATGGGSSLFWTAMALLAGGLFVVLGWRWVQRMRAWVWWALALVALPSIAFAGAESASCEPPIYQQALAVLGVAAIITALIYLARRWRAEEHRDADGLTGAERAHWNNSMVGSFGRTRRTWDVGPASCMALLLVPSLAFADDPAPAPVRAPVMAPQAVPEVAPTAGPKVVLPDLATLPDCISQGAASAAQACVNGTAPKATDRVTFWSTWAASIGSTLVVAGIGWLTNHYALNPDPLK